MKKGDFGNDTGWVEEKGCGEFWLRRAGRFLCDLCGVICEENDEIGFVGFEWTLDGIG